MDLNYNNDAQAVQFVCAAKLYSRVLNEPIWIVVKYPYTDVVEARYPATQASLGLSRRPRWKIWLHPFNPTDDCNVYRLSGADRT
jgi:hypothetical protein